MGLFLMILKIIALIFAGIIAIFVFLALILLFVPFRYRICAEKYTELSGFASVSWLFGLVRFVFTHNDKNGQEVFFRIFGFKLRQKKEIPSDTDGDSKTTGYTADNTASECVGKVKYKPLEPSVAFEGEKTQKEEKTQSDGKPDAPQHIKNTSEAPKKRVKRKKRKKAVIEDTAFDKIKEIWEIENKGEIIKQVLSLIKRLIKSVFNIKLWADFKFGTGQPDTTGYLLGICYVLTGFAGIKIRAEGDFEKQSLSGRAEAKGRIFICALIWAIILFICNKNIFKMIKKYLFKRG